MVLEDFDHLLYDLLIGGLDRVTAAFDVGGRPKQRAAPLVIIEVRAGEIGVDDPLGAGLRNRVRLPPLLPSRRFLLAQELPDGRRVELILAGEMPIEPAVGEAGITHNLLDGHAEKAVAVEEPPGAFKDFLACVALLLRCIGHGFVLRDTTIVRPKDDLEHLLPMGFERGRNLVIQPPARPGVPMTNGPRRVVLITGASSGIGRATAELLATRGHWVFGGVRAPATTRPLAGVELVRLDVRDDA